MTVTSGDGALSTGSVNIAAVAPGLFRANANGQGVPAAVLLRLRADGSQSFESVAQFNADSFTPLPIDLGAATDQLFLVLFEVGRFIIEALPASAR